MPIYPFQCPNCPEYIEINRPIADRDTTINCQKCNADMVRQLTAHGGYHIKGNNGASQRPKNAGSFKRAKS